MFEAVSIEIRQDTVTGIQTETKIIHDEGEILESEAENSPSYSEFTKRQKQGIMFMTTWAAFMSPTSMSIYFPALNAISKDLNVSLTLLNLTVTSYMIFQGLAPTISGDVADMARRRPAYIIGFLVYIATNVG